MFHSKTVRVKNIQILCSKFEVDILKKKKIHKLSVRFCLDAIPNLSPDEICFMSITFFYAKTFNKFHTITIKNISKYIYFVLYKEH